MSREASSAPVSPYNDRSGAKGNPVTKEDQMLHGFPVSGCPHFIAPMPLSGNLEMSYSATPGLLGVFVRHKSALQFLHVYNVDDASIVPNLLHRLKTAAPVEVSQQKHAQHDGPTELYYDFFAMPGSCTEERLEEAKRICTLAGVPDTDHINRIHAVS